ncbi:MAG: tripartite tricarboxylate transporter permease [Proteobacteria bacterium]|nr:tripartite tricarboxylate transporter permease [Pseudomonadota bacterium]MDA1324317.1 tripartite tricarboxylate transporter permease [Pseudomonadota bacterium]
MLESALQGLVMVVSWPAIGYLMVGVLAGIYFGAVPGLSGLVGMAILLPFTFGVEPVAAFALLMGMFAVTTTSDTISSVLLGVPGTSGSQATILDGYPMAQKGEAARAFGAAFTCSAIGGILGALVLGLSLPIVRPLILSFANPEFFMLGVLGLTMVGTLSGGSMLKGLAAACIGILVSVIGYSPQGGLPRFTFDTTYLMDDGLGVIPVVLGLFAIPEVIFLAIRHTSISQVEAKDVSHGMMQGVKDVFENWWLVLRCSVIGMYIGILPGLGASIVDWVAYGHAVQSTKDRENFGKGDVRGVIAPESANNAMKGGALIPTIAFGIPGSATMAILLGAFLIQGLTPGPAMLTTNLHITFSLMWTVMIANVIGSLLLMMWTNQLAKITFIRSTLIVPAIVLFVFMGGWMSGATMGDWYLMLTFGTLGLIMRYAGWARAPLVLGFILGNIMETALDITLQSYTWDWMLRPISGILGALCVLTVVLSARGGMKQRRETPGATFGEGADDEPDAPYRHFTSLPFAGFITLVFAYALWKASGWPREAALLLLTFGCLGIAFSATIFVADLKGFITRSRSGDGGTVAQYVNVLRESREPKGVLGMYGWFALIVAGTYVVGQVYAIPIFIMLYLRFFVGEGWKLTLVYAAAGWLLLWGMFNELIHIVWHTPLFDIFSID